MVISFLIIPFVSLPTLATEGDVLFFDDFNDGNFIGWTIESGNWYVTNGQLAGSQSGRAYSGNINTGSSEWDNYRIESDVYAYKGVDQGIEFRYTSNDSYGINLRYGTGLYDTPQVKLWKNSNNQPVMIADTNSFPLRLNNWYHVTIEALNENIKVWINNTLILDFTDPGTTIKKGAISLGYWTGDISVANMRFDNIKVTALAPPPSPAPSPFLDLPWDYEGKGLSFNEAATSITSFFDHKYPLLSGGLSEPTDGLNLTLGYDGHAPEGRNYSNHDGYDYAKLAKVNLGDPVLAAAAGEATYINTCGACGNMILIDHKNGYQTRYLHLQKDGLITDVPGQKIQVAAHQPIGKVGATGNVSPPGDAGSHIHFGVFQDKNKDGNFNDDIPDGVTDPFGWQSKDPDPWETYTFFYNGQNRTGNKSYYLWIKKLDNLDSTLTSNGGVFKTSRATINFPAGATNQNLNINIQSSPIVKVNNILSSIGSTIVATAKNTLGNLVTNFQEFFTITIDFNGFDLSRYKTDTISIYSSPDNINWTKEETTINWTEKTASASLNHFTHFALMAERIDTTPPLTTAILAGQQSQSNWFRSDVQVSLDAQDNEGGLGVDYTMYRIAGADWEIYAGPLTFTNEGHYKIEFYSADNDENLEDIESVEFDIDKTAPDASIDVNPKTLWPPNNKMVNVTVTGNSSDTHPYSTNIIVDDKYNLIEPTIYGFNQTIQLEAKREGGDLEGRVYIIKVTAEDLAGNITEKQVEVIVPHDQRKSQ